MLDGLLQWFHREQRQQDANEAIIDLMLLLSHVDGKIKQAEQNYIDGYIDDLPWHSGLSKESYHASALDRCRKALAEGQVDALLHSISQRLQTEPDRYEALEQLESLANSDGGLDDREQALIQSLKGMFAV